jgi:perosamine synthetase
MKYLINSPSLSSLEKKYVNDVLKSTWLSSNGIHTQKFEKKVCKFLGAKYSMAVQSGTAALHLALKTMGCKNGDRVIIPNYSCSSNLTSVIQCGAKPIIVEVENNTLGLNAELLKRAIKLHKPKIVQLVHVYGFPANDTQKIIKICKENKILLLEDFSEALGAKIKNKKVGSMGDIGIFSIRSEKMIGVGEGGVLVTNNKNFYNLAEKIGSRNTPFRGKKDPYWKKYHCLGEGYNYKLPHLLGAIGRGQIERFEKEILPKKIKIGKIYEKIFNNEHFRITQNYSEKIHKPVFWLNSIYFKNISKNKVRNIGLKLQKHGIEVRSGFWPLSSVKNVNSKYIYDKKISKNIYENTLVLPSNTNLSLKDIKYIKKIITKYL